MWPYPDSLLYNALFVTVAKNNLWPYPDSLLYNALFVTVAKNLADIICGTEARSRSDSVQSMSRVGSQLINQSQELGVSWLNWLQQPQIQCHDESNLAVNWSKAWSRCYRD